MNTIQFGRIRDKSFQYERGNVVTRRIKSDVERSSVSVGGFLSTKEKTDDLYYYAELKGEADKSGQLTGLKGEISLFSTPEGEDGTGYLLQDKVHISGTVMSRNPIVLSGLTHLDSQADQELAQDFVELGNYLNQQLDEVKQ